VKTAVGGSLQARTEATSVDIEILVQWIQLSTLRPEAPSSAKHKEFAVSEVV
jgi:hypothetical protein